MRYGNETNLVDTLLVNFGVLFDYIRLSRNSVKFHTFQVRCRNRHRVVITILGCTIQRRRLELQPYWVLSVGKNNFSREFLLVWWTNHTPSSATSACGQVGSYSICYGYHPHKQADKPLTNYQHTGNISFSVWSANLMCLPDNIFATSVVEATSTGSSPLWLFTFTSAPFCNR